ncbi:MAG: MSHA pilin protein MshA [Chlamydiales bacterium]|jgi:MSHA pilin protein MshA
MKLQSLPPTTSGRSAFTLVELVIVIIVLGILAAVAIPKFMDFSTDAEAAACKGSLGGVRSGIATFYAHSATPAGGGSVSFPTLSELNTISTVLEQQLPDNPYSTGANKNGVVAGTTKGTPVTAGTGGAWCYKASTGEFWADTASGASEADF